MDQFSPIIKQENIHLKSSKVCIKGQIVKHGPVNKVVAPYRESLPIFPGNFIHTYFNLMERVAGAGRN